MINVQTLFNSKTLPTEKQLEEKAALLKALGQDIPPLTPEQIQKLHENIMTVEKMKSLGKSENLHLLVDDDAPVIYIDNLMAAGHHVTRAGDREFMDRVGGFVVPPDVLAANSEMLAMAVDRDVCNASTIAWINQRAARQTATPNIDWEPLDPNKKGATKNRSKYTRLKGKRKRGK